MAIGSGFLSSLQNLWPFSVFKYDDLRASDKLVRKLLIPETTRQFVFGIEVPETKSVVYVLSAQSLSEQSAIDAQCLIRAVKPDGIIAQVGETGVYGIESEEGCSEVVPVSVFGVLKRCFVDKVHKEKYEQVAGDLVLREIFGVGFYGHVMAAKRVAEEVGSSFLVVESAFRRSYVEDSGDGEGELIKKFHGFVDSLVPKKLGSAFAFSPRRFCLNNDVQCRIAKMLSAYMALSELKLGDFSSVEEESKEIEPKNDYEAPLYAQPIYTLLVDLRDIFSDLPLMGRALAYAQKMFCDVNSGKLVDPQAISGVYAFRVAVEGLRIALNNAGRLPIKKTGMSNSSRIDFSELPVEEKSHVLFAQALRSQSENFKTIVAIVDSRALAGLRKHWNTPVTPEIVDLVAQNVMIYDSDGELLDHTERKSLLGKPMVAVGAGATAVLGASSLSKAVPTSTFIKLVTLKVPASFNLFFTYAYNAMALGFTKTLGPAKVVASGVASSGAKTTYLLKSAASAERIRTVVHTVIASVEKTSLSTMRAAFYEIMRKRRVRPVTALPWATFGCSIATCTGLLVYGDGIECAAVSLPAAPSIASLGRGIQNLRQASQSVQTDKNTVQKSIEYLMCSLKKVKIQ